MTKTIENLSNTQARKLVLLSQNLPTVKQNKTAIDATLSAIEQLSYIQIDTISVVQRAHHHTLWNRNPDYESHHLDELMANKKIFEYWSHAAAYLPITDYRYTLPRKQAIANGLEKHWYQSDKQVMKSVLERISSDGPLMAKDFEHKGPKIGDWNTKPAKRALEDLFIQGKLMISSRVNFHKVYDLTERVLPENIDTSLPLPEEYARFLILRYLKANGLGQATEITYLRKNIKTLIAATLLEMLDNGEILEVNVEGSKYYTLAESLEMLNMTLPISPLKILSPFDNLLIQRKRMQALFNYNYQIECYVPQAKRQYGYFSLPLLWQGKLVARMDCKAERKKDLLHIYHLALEPAFHHTEAFTDALRQELISFMRFNNCSKIQLYRTSPDSLQPILQSALQDLT